MMFFLKGIKLPEDFKQKYKTKAKVTIQYIV